MSRKLLITGASSEIGAAICRKIIAPGDEATLQYTSHAKSCEGLASTLPGVCIPHRTDFLNDGEVEELCAIAAECDVLVNCAAYVHSGLLLMTGDDALEKAVRINIVALTKLCRAALSGMLTKRSGNIVNVSSYVAGRGNRGQAVYAGTKGYMESFSRALAAEYGSRGIRVNCVAPGAIGAGSFKGLLVDAEKEIRESVALRRIGTAEDVACAVEYLCSEGARYVTGTVLRVDGGYMKGV